MVDVIVVGGGPAGLQAALTLARGQRSVAVVDAGPPRNARSRGVHNFLSRDGLLPADLRAAAHADLARYGIAVREARALRLDGGPDGFVLATTAGDVAGRRVLVAAGVVDVLPAVPGFDRHWGGDVFACPYCHGHERRGRRWAVRVDQPHLVDLALFCRGFTDDLVVLTDGAALSEADRARFARAGVPVDERPVAALLGDDGLAAVRFAEGPDRPVGALLWRPAQRQLPFVEALGLATDPGGYVVVDPTGRTSRPGISAAGDLTTPGQSALAAAASGMMAAARLAFDVVVEPLPA